MNFFNILILFLGLNTNITHEFHLSKCLIKYDTEASSLQISMHIFLDDLELALKDQGANDLYLCTDKEAPEAVDYILTYIGKQFHIKQNGEDLETFFLGKEISEDLAAVWCYLEIPNVLPEGELEIKNEILLDQFDDQKNVTSIKLPSSNEYFLFQKGETIDKLSF